MASTQRRFEAAPVQLFIPTFHGISHNNPNPQWIFTPPTFSNRYCGNLCARKAGEVGVRAARSRQAAQCVICCLGYKVLTTVGKPPTLCPTTTAPFLNHSPEAKPFPRHCLDVTEQHSTAGCSEDETLPTEHTRRLCLGPCLLTPCRALDPTPPQSALHSRASPDEP